jgi:hypothetical protein
MYFREDSISSSMTSPGTYSLLGDSERGSLSERRWSILIAGGIAGGGSATTQQSDQHGCSSSHIQRDTLQPLESCSFGHVHFDLSETWSDCHETPRTSRLTSSTGLDPSGLMTTRPPGPPVIPAR